MGASWILLTFSILYFIDIKCGDGPGELIQPLQKAIC